MIRRILVIALLIQVGCESLLATSQPPPHFTFSHANTSILQLSVAQAEATGFDSTLKADSAAGKFPSPSVAQSKSLLYTLIPLPTLVLTVPALIAGPSAGYFYAGMNRRAWTGIGLRTLALGGMFSAFGICGWDCGPGEDSYTIAWAVFIGSGGILTVSAIYDIATVKEATKLNNERRANKSVTVYPGYFPRLKTFGLMVSHRF